MPENTTRPLTQKELMQIVLQLAFGTHKIADVAKLINSEPKFRIKS